MDYQWVAFACILIINAMMAFVIATVLARRPQTPGIYILSVSQIGLCIWSFSYAMITLTESLEVKYFWLKLENVGILSVPVLWFIFALKYAQIRSWLLLKPVQLLFWVAPTITMAFLLSNRWFGLYYSSIRPATQSIGPLVIGRGPWYWVQLFQNYLLTLGGMGALIWRFIQSRHIYRQQLLLLIGAVFVPFALNAVYQLNPGLLPFFSVPVDLTPLSFTVATTLIATNVYGLRLFDLVPIARDTVMEHIPEMVFVVDSHDRIVDANSMAQKWLGKPIGEIIGRLPAEVFRDWPQLLNRFLGLEYTREEIQIPGDPYHTLELVITPIHNNSKALEGHVIVAYDVTQRKALEDDLKEANESLKIQLAEIESLRVRLQEQAIRDPLTGVFNRRFFAESLDKVSARAHREGLPFSIVIMDVDHFKSFNDEFGHKCGDLVLLSLAKFVSDNTRRGDIVCRYGGEEFVILLPNTFPGDAYERAEKLRSEFESRVVEYEGHRLSVTFSVGVAGFPVHGLTGDAVLQSADHALYQSKDHGRNRVTVYIPAP